MDTLANNHEKLRLFCNNLYKQVTEQNTTIRDLNEKNEKMEKKVNYLENNVTLAQVKFSNEDDHNIIGSLNNDGDEPELILLE